MFRVAEPILENRLGREIVRIYAKLVNFTSSLKLAFSCPNLPFIPPNYSRSQEAIKENNKKIFVDPKKVTDNFSETFELLKQYLLN